MLGVSTPQVVEQLFRHASLFCVPISNTFGMKLKVAEAISYGTPFIASKETMLGYPQMSGIPALDLGNPEQAAHQIVNLVRTPGALESLRNTILERQRAWMPTQKNIWSRTLGGRMTPHGKF
jgi:glycosyltransferase involved in cell wall biosynthesis